jgi:hypothetical protein
MLVPDKTRLGKNVCLSNSIRVNQRFDWPQEPHFSILKVQNGLIPVFCLFMPRSNDSTATSASSGSFTRFEYQVAGHDRLLQHPASDIIVVKPCNRIEQKFYQDSQQHAEFLQWIPECYGSLHIATESERQTLIEAQDGVKSISLNEQLQTHNQAELDDILFVITLFIFLFIPF